MTKNKALKKYEAELADPLEFNDDFDFPDDYSHDDEAFAGVISGLIEASNQQTMAAIELTKLVVAKSSDQTMTEDKIFATFKRASKVVYDIYPLKSLLEQGI